MCVYTYIYTYIHMCIHIYIYTCVYVYIYIYVCVCSLSPPSWIRVSQRLPSVRRPQFEDDNIEMASKTVVEVRKGDATRNTKLNVCQGHGTAGERLSRNQRNHPSVEMLGDSRSTVVAETVAASARLRIDHKPSPEAIYIYIYIYICVIYIYIYIYICIYV